MKEKDRKEKELIAMLKELGTAEPSEAFSKRLTNAVVHGHKKQLGAAYKAEKWLGKFILSVLVFFNLLFLYYLNPFVVQQELFISVAAFVLGLWALIVMVRKGQSSVS